MERPCRSTTYDETTGLTRRELLSRPHPEANSRMISDNGPQFIAKDFKEFIRISGMAHVRTSPNYPQSN